MKTIWFILLGIFYTVPALALIWRMVSGVARAIGAPWAAENRVISSRLSRLNEWAGRLEYTTGHFRDYTTSVIIPIVALITLIRLLWMRGAMPPGLATTFLFYGALAAIARYTYRRHLRVSLRMMEFTRRNPFADPREFWGYYYSRLGPLAISVPDHAATTIDPTHIDFRRGRKNKSIWPMLLAIYDTSILARSLWKSFQILGLEFARDACDGVGRLWGARVAQIIECELTARGSEHLASLPGKIILVLNHKSHLDFAMTFLAVGHARRLDGRLLRPRFMAAKDHFVDNRFVYSVMGVGRMMEAIDMIFVDRKRSDAGKEAVSKAAQSLAAKEVEIALFPQGTRALGITDAQGERNDAGYYTTVKARNIDKPYSHLKKGVAYLALDTAMALAPQNIPVHLVCIGINGSGTGCPKQSLRIQTGSQIHFEVGKVITLTPDQVGDIVQGDDSYIAKVDSILAEIDQGLVEAMGLHQQLKKRLLQEVKAAGVIPASKLSELTGQLDQPELATTLYPLLDRIWALHRRVWPAYIKEVTQLVMKSAAPSSEGLLKPLLDRVTMELVEGTR